MANALACAVSVASVELLLGQDWRAGSRDFGRAARRTGARAALPGVADVRVRAPSASSRWTDPSTRPPPGGARPRVWLRPFRNLIYAMPPFICTPAEIEQITSAMVAVAAKRTNLNGVQHRSGTGGGDPRLVFRPAWLWTVEAQRRAAGLRRSLRPRWPPRRWWIWPPTTTWAWLSHPAVIEAA